MPDYNATISLVCFFFLLSFIAVITDERKINILGLRWLPVRTMAGFQNSVIHINVLRETISAILFIYLFELYKNRETTVKIMKILSFVYIVLFC
jgi:hypothetical protein